MVQILLVLGTIVLILLSIFLVLLVLLQRGSSSGGLGTAFGGDAMTSAFGTETGNFLSKATVWGTVAFFVLTFGLYLGHMASLDSGRKRGGGLPTADLLVDPAPASAPATPGTGAEVAAPEGTAVTGSEAIAPEAAQPAPEATAPAPEPEPAPAP